MKKVLQVLLHAMTMLSLLFLSIRVLGLETYFFQWFYSQNNTAANLGMSYADLMRATEQLLKYMLDQASTIQSEVVVYGQTTLMFNQREIDHMVDVLYLIRAMRIVMVISLSTSAIVYWTKRSQQAFKDSLKQTYTIALGVLGGLMSAIGVFAWFDFESFWIIFHQLIFTNDLWLLDPRTDRLINMVPLNFFMTLVFSIIITTVLLNGLYAYFIHRYSSK
jgi:integral membrane protein (TIGR01906 family)